MAPAVMKDAAKKLRAAVRNARQSIIPERDSLSTWFTPWTWADAGRLYYGDDGYWLYRSLPSSVLYNDNQDLILLLRDLYRHFPDRGVHLLLHNKTAPIVLPDQTPNSLAELLAPLVNLYSTKTHVTVGIQLQPQGKTEKSKKEAVAGGVSDSVDWLLGETVPDFESVADERSKADAVFTTHRCLPASVDDAMNLEAWHLLGANTDPVVTEDETVILFGNASTLALCALSDVQRSSVPRHIPSPNAEQAATVLSVRGMLDKEGIKNYSVVAGRRSQGGGRWQSELAAAFPECSSQSLPLRQLPALSETLPCSQDRMLPEGQELLFGQLTACGVSDNLRVGDRSGLHLGLVGNQYSELGWWNAVATPGQYAHVVAEAGSGKTFLAEYLAIQHVVAGGTVTYLSGDGESARPLVTNKYATPIASPVPGLATVPYLPPDVSGNEVFVRSLHAIEGSVSRNEWRSLLATAYAQDPDYVAGLAGAEFNAVDETLAARLVKATRSNSAYALLSGNFNASGSLAVAVNRVLRDVPEVAHELLSDLLIAASVLRGGLTIADGVKPGAITWWAWEQAQQKSLPSSLLITSREVAFTGTRPDLAIGGAQQDPHKAMQTLNWLGIASNEERLAWLRDSRPIVAGQNVLVTPTMLIRDKSNRTAPLTVGPIPLSLLSLLTRGAATDYR